MPNDYSKYAVSEYEKVVLKVYEKYEDKLRHNNSVDFDDLLLLPIRLFLKVYIVLEEQIIKIY